MLPLSCRPTQRHGVLAVACDSGAKNLPNIFKSRNFQELFGGAYDDAKPFDRCKYGALSVRHSGNESGDSGPNLGSMIGFRAEGVGLGVSVHVRGHVQEHRGSSVLESFARFRLR